MTVKELRDILGMLDDNVEVKIGYGESANPIKFVAPRSDYVLLHPAIYEADPNMTLLATLATYGKKN